MSQERKCSSVPLCSMTSFESESSSAGYCSNKNNEEDSLSVSSDYSETTFYADMEVLSILSRTDIVYEEPVVERCKNPPLMI